MAVFWGQIHFASQKLSIIIGCILVLSKENCKIEEQCVKASSSNSHDVRLPSPLVFLGRNNGRHRSEGRRRAIDFLLDLKRRGAQGI